MCSAYKTYMLLAMWWLYAILQLALYFKTKQQQNSFLAIYMLKYNRQQIVNWQIYGWVAPQLNRNISGLSFGDTTSKVLTSPDVKILYITNMAAVHVSFYI
jgi:hypothetical protein